MVGMRISELRRLAFLLSAIFVLVCDVSARAQVYSGKPKLIVVVVIDQFRADHLNRHQADFKGRGFNLFMKEGAWFTDCYYDYANTKTGPGHATIGTGAYSDGHGIDNNEWWDAGRSFDETVNVVEDERYHLVDVPQSSIPADPAKAAKFLVGASPMNLRASSLGDELRLATQGKARVFGLSLKDRASILPTGQAANGAYWIDPQSGAFITSTYYMEHLPQWAAAFNASGRAEQARHEAKVDDKAVFYSAVGKDPAANRYELDFAKALITAEKLGQNGVTDELVVSLSPNDFQGHQYGPDSDSQNQMTLALDKDLDSFFTWLDQNIGLQNVWLGLSADHGVAPVASEAAKLGVHGAVVDMNKVYAQVGAEFNKRHSSGQNLHYLMSQPDLPYIVLDKRVFQKLGIDEKTAEEELAGMLPDLVAALDPNAPPMMAAGQPEPKPSEKRLPFGPRADLIYTRLQLASGQLPPTQWGELIAHSYVSHGNWFVMLILDGYQMQGSGPMMTGTTHFSPWSYDRHVPLAFYGAPFKPGEYHQLVAPVDMAVTFASLAGVNRPSAAVGRVLTEAIKPAVANGAK
jgi:Type I phosphodiesterase / nucleotide pyrophosphatase